MTTLGLQSVSVRPAERADFEWIADLMDRVLSPFYDGNHRAHAQRIFETHISGGIDRVGHFSAGQHMWIAEIDGVRAGLLNVADKKQATVKISPLIVDSDFRGRHGIGSVLLAKAEEFAESVGARQLYCTVASPNQKALQFFVKKGFQITGTAIDHYRIGVDEHMLYKELQADTGFDYPNVSVVPFSKQLHSEAVRCLILNNLQRDFDGIDDSWVDVTFAGYERRLSGDINSKYKIIYVAESNGEVVGVASATPKKGEPIKLMPLVATSRPAFEALIIDLQGLLSEVGHKLYMHIVPLPWQVSCLQHHGWRLEGVFPGGYSRDSVVQQWGHRLNEGGKDMHKMRIKRPYFNAVMAGSKTLEVRVGYDGIKRYRVGDRISLETSRVSGVVRIKDIREYDSLRNAITHEDWQHIIPDARSESDALERLREIYPPHKESLGIFVFEIIPVGQVEV